MNRVPPGPDHEPPSRPLAGKGPVVWGVGANFLFGLRKTLLYALFADRLDPRDWMSGSVHRAPPASETHGDDAPEDGYWLDLVCDTGDSQRAVYSLAYLVHGDLFVDDPDGAVRAGEVECRAGLLEVGTTDGSGKTRLARGSILFVGGDTAYSVGDERTIQERLIAPFDHARAQRFSGGAPRERWLLGIPGNHDWYDSLDGFNRLFRRPVGSAPPLALRGFQRVQQASYFALELGAGWALWAIDARDGGDVDPRQRAFFREQPAPENLIVATPMPPVPYGRRAAWLPRLIEELLPHAHDRIRLWTSGDLHHYARHEASLSSAPDGIEASAPGAKVTCVTCGLGGASMHVPWPLGEVPFAAVYPEPGPSRRAVQRRLLSPMFITELKLWLPAALVGALLGLGVGFPGGEAATFVRALWGLVSGAPVAFPQPLVLGAIVLLLVSSIAAPLLARRKLARTEAQAREHPLGLRTLATLGPQLLVLLGLAGLVLAGVRTLGGVLVDGVFFAGVLLVLAALPYTLASDLPQGRARLAAVVIPLALMLVFLLLTVGAACGAGVLVEGSSAPVQLVASVLGGAIASALLLPLLVGAAFAAGMSLGAQLIVASSLAHIDDHQAFLRLRLRIEPDGSSSVTGYVVGVTHTVARSAIRARRPRPGALVPRARLIDVFRVSGKK